jgi:N-acetyl-gamma-glutamyl-phosphate reductase
MIRAAVAGASGYGGGELLRLLEGHPQVEVVEIAAGEAAGRPLADVWPHLRDRDGRHVSAMDPDALGEDSDVAFLALPHGLALDAAPAALSNGARVVDLGGDFRLRDPESYRRHYGRDHTRPGLLGEAVYGLPELDDAGLEDARLVANPGCYATAALLALAPLVREGRAAGTLYVDGKSGISGAGRTPTSDTAFAEADGTVRPYAVANHRHAPEIEQALGRLGAGPGGSRGGSRVCFTPHVVPMTRGLLATCFVPLGRGLGDGDARELYRDAYAEAPFVRVADDPPRTKATAGSNHCDVAVRVDEERGAAVALAALDNLGKGAAGQAVQNMNLMFGLDEREGLWTTPIYP